MTNSAQIIRDQNGKPAFAVLPIDDVARAAGTVGYELMCALALRVPTIVHDG